MNIKSIGFIGGGRVTYLLLQALRRQNALPKQVLVADPNKDSLDKVQAISPDSIFVSTHNVHAVEADLVFLAVHPPVVAPVLQELSGSLKTPATLVSLAPTFPFRKLQDGLAGFQRLVRLIPNAPSIINQGYNPVAFHSAIAQEEKAGLLDFFKHFGATPEVDEKLLEAYAIVAAMGPTYFWFQWLELQRLAQEFGIKDDAAKEALAGMLHGAVDTLFKSNLPPNEVLNLIPVYPMKNHEEVILDKFTEILISLHNKLSGS